VSAPTSLQLQTMLRSLGVAGSQNIPLNTAELTPVVQVADFSNTLVAETLEARGVLSTQIGAAVPAGDIPVLVLISRGPGGVVVEDFRTIYQVQSGASSSALAVEGSVYVTIVLSDDPSQGRVPFTATGPDLSIISVGGIFPRSIPVRGFRPGILVLDDRSFWLPPDYSQPNNVRWFFPGGAFVLFSYNTVFNGGVTPLVSLTMTLREVQSGTPSPFVEGFT